MKTKWFMVPALLLATSLAFAPSAAAQLSFTKTTISEGVFVVHTDTQVPLPGGGKFQMNNLLLVQPDDVILVDTLFTPPAVYYPFSGAIHSLTSARPVSAIINTGWHADHVGLDLMFRMVEGTGTLLAHLKTGEFLTSPPPCGTDLPPAFCINVPILDPMAQPTQGIEGKIKMWLPTETVTLKTFEHAHSGADLAVFLERANVVATGDIYFGGMYPVIDREAGGSVNGVLAALHQVLAHTNEDTVIVPSHGPIGNHQALVDFTNMITTTRKMVRRLIARGFTEEQVMAHASFAPLDARWGTGFINGPLFRKIVYRDLVSR